MRSRRAAPAGRRRSPQRPLPRRPRTRDRPTPRTRSRLRRLRRRRRWTGRSSPRPPGRRTAAPPTSDKEAPRSDRTPSPSARANASADCSRRCGSGSNAIASAESRSRRNAGHPRAQGPALQELRGSPADQRPQRRAQPVDVAARRSRAAGQHLGCREPRRAQAAGRRPVARPDVARDAEVDQDDSVVGHDQVRRLDVAMDDLLRVDVRQRLAGLGRVLDGPRRPAAVRCARAPTPASARAPAPSPARRRTRRRRRGPSTRTTRGCRNRASSRASIWNRSALRCSSGCLTATSASSRSRRARYTAPIPPVEIGASITYSLPISVPGARTFTGVVSLGSVASWKDP